MFITAGLYFCPHISYTNVTVFFLILRVTNQIYFGIYMLYVDCLCVVIPVPNKAPQNQDVQGRNGHLHAIFNLGAK